MDTQDAAEYLQDFSQKIDSIEESAREIHVRTFGEDALWKNLLLKQVTHIKWILAGLLLVSVWRFF